MVKRADRVAIIHRDLPHYRVPFFEGLRRYLEERDVTLDLYHGRPHAKMRGNEAFLRELSWARPFDPWRLTRKIVWQPVFLRALCTDLVIVEGATGVLVNYPLFIASRIGGPRFAIWGHGWGHQASNPNSRSERLKLWLARHADWYFAYTDEVKQGLIARGCEGTRIFDTQNATVAPELPEDRAEARREVLAELGLSDDAEIALFCGRLNPSKQIGNLVKAAVRAQAQCPKLVTVIAGDGPDAPIAREGAAQHACVHYIGPLFGARKGAFLAAARYTVMPGSVGLGILDSFHSGAPPIATTSPLHGPEFAYLTHQDNGIICDNTPEALAEAMVALAGDDALQARLVEGCRRVAQAVTLEEMIRRYGEGVLTALQSKYRPAIEGSSPKSLSGQ